MSDSELISSYDSDSEMMDNQRRRQLFGQITELQSAVTDMKCAFTTAIQQLGTFQHEEKDIWDKIESNKTESENQVAEVLKLMLSMRTEFVALKNQLQRSHEVQQNLQQQVQNLAWERILLIEELYKSGSISEQIRYHLQSCHRHFVSRATSGTQSNDSGVTMLSDKAAAHSPFQATSLAISSDQDNESFYEPSHAFESPLCHDYVVGLSEVKASGLIHSCDSESSLVNAANKSLTLSSSLGKQCGLELDWPEDDTDDDEEDAAVSARDAAKTALSQEEAENFAVPSVTLNFDENQRKVIVAGILETERSYCKILLTLQEIFAEPLKRNGIISSKDSNTLFPNEVNKIYEKHSTFLLELELVTDGNVGRVFDRFTDPVESSVLRLYTSYVDDFPEVLKVFHKLCRQKNKAFTDFLKSCLVQPECGGLDLGVFLVAPVQRIPRYVLFLKKLLRICGDDSDRLHLQNCLRRLKDFLERLNDTVEHSFQLIVSQIHPDKNMLLSDSGCSHHSLVKHKMAPCGIANATADAQLIWSRNSDGRENEEVGCRDASGTGSRCYRYPWRCRTDGSEGTKCGYPTCRPEAASKEAHHGFPSNAGRGKRKARSCSVGTPLHSVDSDAADVEKSGPAKDRACDEGGRLMDAQGEEAADGEWKAERPECRECTAFPRKISVDGSRCDADAKPKDDCQDRNETGPNPERNSVSKGKLNSKCKQTEACTSSEPNLTDAAIDEVLTEPEEPRRGGHCCCGGGGVEKGASLACIVPSCGEDRNKRPLAKSQSSFSVHQHSRGCAVSNDAPPRDVGSSAVVGTGSSKIVHSASSPTLKDKKKVSIRTSLKNLLFFKKRSSSSHDRHRNNAFSSCSDCRKLSVDAASAKADS